MRSALADPPDSIVSWVDCPLPEDPLAVEKLLKYVILHVDEGFSQ
jgi:hypothetical protein